MSKNQNRAMVINYYGTVLPIETRQAVAELIAPVVVPSHRNEIVITQLNEDEITAAIAAQAAKNVIRVEVSEKTTPEIEAAKLIGITFKDVLASGSYVDKTLRMANCLSSSDNSDKMKAIRAAFKKLAQEGAYERVPVELRTKYNLNCEVFRIIYDLSRAFRL